MILERKKPHGWYCQEARNLENLASVLTAHHFFSLQKTERPQKDSIKKEEENHPTESLVLISDLIKF